MRFFTITVILFLLISCKEEKPSIHQFKTGTYQTFLEDSDATSMAVRNDSIQIETFNATKDTFAIEWMSNFEYQLIKINPKNELDSTPFIVKITGFKKDSYTFKAYYKGSNFKQTGKAIKLND